MGQVPRSISRVVFFIYLCASPITDSPTCCHLLFLACLGEELIIGNRGENIAAVPIEDQVKAHCDGINEAPWPEHMADRDLF